MTSSDWFVVLVFLACLAVLFGRRRAYRKVSVRPAHPTEGVMKMARQLKNDPVVFVFGKGQLVKDLVTGMTGVVVGRCDNITGCNQYIVQPKAKEDGNVPDSRWVDEHRLEGVLNADQIVLKPGATGDGGDTSMPMPGQGPARR